MNTAVYVTLSAKESTWQFRRCKGHDSDPWVKKIPWSGRKWQSTLVFLPRKFHRQRSLVCYTPWGHEESEMTEWLNTHMIPGCRRVWEPPLYINSLSLRIYCATWGKKPWLLIRPGVVCHPMLMLAVPPSKALGGVDWVFTMVSACGDLEGHSQCCSWEKL